MTESLQENNEKAALDKVTELRVEVRLLVLEEAAEQAKLKFWRLWDAIQDNTKRLERLAHFRDELLEKMHGILATQDARLDELETRGVGWERSFRELVRDNAELAKRVKTLEEEGGKAP